MTLSGVAHVPARFRNWIDLVSVLRALIASRPTSYRPEKYYMRGPGPKWREKNARHGNAA
ncbi:MAG: hypothetical protein K2X43_11585 [Hyphomonadaceae bacterium]|nr:hypothetical protein [Hyphomonadaceae bacterium]